MKKIGSVIGFFLLIIIVGIALISGISGTPADDSGSGTPGQYESGATLEQTNALTAAKLYLSTMPFSYEGLIDQLEFEGYSYSAAKYGADNCGANWNQQAAKAAKLYLDTMPFSRSELIKQLEYDKFTHEQAVYGVEANGY